MRHLHASVGRRIDVEFRMGAANVNGVCAPTLSCGFIYSCTIHSPRFCSSSPLPSWLSVIIFSVSANSLLLPYLRRVIRNFTPQCGWLLPSKPHRAAHSRNLDLTEQRGRCARASAWTSCSANHYIVKYIEIVVCDSDICTYKQIIAVHSPCSKQ